MRMTEALLSALFRKKWQFTWARADNPERDGLAVTALIWKHLALSPGMRVADVGAGFGYFALKIAEVVGAEGWVLATEASPATFVRLRADAERARHGNLTARLRFPLWLGLGQGAFDRVLMVNVFPFEEGRERRSRSLLEQIARGLRANGRFVLFADAIHTTEWRPPYGTRLRRSQSTAEQIVALARDRFEVEALEEVVAGPPERGKRPGYVLSLRKR
jgi:SAM-dependent methyltransferase